MWIKCLISFVQISHLKFKLYPYSRYYFFINLFYCCSVVPKQFEYSHRISLWTISVSIFIIPITNEKHEYIIWLQHKRPQLSIKDIRTNTHIVLHCTRTNTSFLVCQIQTILRASPPAWICHRIAGFTLDWKNYVNTQTHFTCVHLSIRVYASEMCLCINIHFHTLRPRCEKITQHALHASVNLLTCK